MIGRKPAVVSKMREFRVASETLQDRAREKVSKAFPFLSMLPKGRAASLVRARSSSEEHGRKSVDPKSQGEVAAHRLLPQYQLAKDIQEDMAANQRKFKRSYQGKAKDVMRRPSGTISSRRCT